MKLNHIYKSIACGVLLAMTATSCDLDYNPVDTYSDVTEGVNKTDEKPIFNSVQDVETSMVTLHKKFLFIRMMPITFLRRCYIKVSKPCRC